MSRKNEILGDEINIFKAEEYFLALILIQFFLIGIYYSLNENLVIGFLFVIMCFPIFLMLKSTRKLKDIFINSPKITEEMKSEILHQTSTKMTNLFLIFTVSFTTVLIKTYNYKWYTSLPISIIVSIFYSIILFIIIITIIKVSSRLYLKSATDLFNQGLKYYKLGNFNKSIENYTKAIEKDSKLAIAYLNRGNAYDNLEMQEKAINDFSKAIELKNDYSEAYTNRGNSFFKANDLCKAIEDYSNAININPNDDTAYCGRGTAQDSLENSNEAINDFTKAISINPSNFLSFSNRGAVYFKLENYNKSIEDYTEAIKIKPDFSDVFYNRGLSYIKINNKTEAKRDLEIAFDNGHFNAIQLIKKYCE